MKKSWRKYLGLGLANFWLFLFTSKAQAETKINSIPIMYGPTVFKPPTMRPLILLRNLGTRVILIAAPFVGLVWYLKRKKRKK